MRLAVVALVPWLVVGSIEVSSAVSESELERLISSDVAAMIPADRAGGVAVAVRMKGQNLFFNYGFASRAANRPITSDSLFNLASLRKLFEVTLLAMAVKQGELRLDDPAAKYVIALRQESYISRVTLGQLATHTSGLLLPTDHPPWPDYRYTLSEFFRVLNTWTPDQGQEPGKQHLYSHAGFVLLQLALERRFAAPISELMRRRLFDPLGLSSTAVPERGSDGRAELPPALMDNAVQGYSAASLRSARQATSRAISIFLAPARCSRPHAISPYFSRLILASCNSIAFYGRRCN
jgi:beta-lactamase class C